MRVRGCCFGTKTMLYFLERLEPDILLRELLANFFVDFWALRIGEWALIFNDK